MKKLLLATALSGFAVNQALAGGLAPEIVMAPEIVIEETTASTSQNLIIPLILLALIAVAISSTSGGGGDSTNDISDMRLKTDIAQIGTAANGLPLYQFRYLGDTTLYEGVMAQDVLQHTPAAVLTGPLGVMAVDYGMLGLEMKIID